MKYLIGCFAALAMMAAGVSPVHAQEDEIFAHAPDHGVTCADHYADWQSAYYEEASQETAAKPVTGERVKGPPGTNRAVFLCRMGGHSVRMVFSYEPTPRYRCGAAANALISVWVDSVKVVDRRQWGDYDSCYMIGSDDKSYDQTLVRIIVNDQMRLTLCTRDLTSSSPTVHTDLKPGQSDEAFQWGEGPNNTSHYVRTCTVEDLVLPAGARAETVTRTPPGLELAEDNAPLCTALSREMVYLPVGMSDPSLKSRRLGDLEAWLAVRETPQARPDFLLHVDNDGVMDRLTALLPGPGAVEWLGLQYRWTSGASGQAYPITGKLAGEGDNPRSVEGWADPVFGGVSFVRIDGRTYLYVTEVGWISGFPTDVWDIEGKVSTDPGDDRSTRRLIELHPDGTAKLLCAWAPRKRPEEFL